MYFILVYTMRKVIMDIKKFGLAVSALWGLNFIIRSSRMDINEIKLLNDDVIMT